MLSERCVIVDGVWTRRGGIAAKFRRDFRIISSATFSRTFSRTSRKPRSVGQLEASAISWLIVPAVYAKRVHRNMDRNMRAAYIGLSSSVRIPILMNIIGLSRNCLTMQLPSRSQWLISESLFLCFHVLKPLQASLIISMFARVERETRLLYAWRTKLLAKNSFSFKA